MSVYYDLNFISSHNYFLSEYFGVSCVGRTTVQATVAAGRVSAHVTSIRCNHIKIKLLLLSFLISILYASRLMYARACDGVSAVNHRWTNSWTICTVAKIHRTITTATITTHRDRDDAIARIDCFLFFLFFFLIINCKQTHD